MTREDPWLEHPAALPEGSAIAGWYADAFLADAFEARLPPRASRDPERLARFMLERQAPWVGHLMRVRDLLVAGFGLKTARQLQAGHPSDRARRIHIFKIHETRADEIVLGEDDKHLDFRLSVMVRTRPSPSGPTRHVVATTVVNCHNLLGRNYIRLIAPFHRLVVRSTLRRAARRGWPLADAAPAPASSER